MYLRFGVLLLALVVAPAAFARSKQQVVQIEPAQFAQSRADIETAVTKTDRYNELTRTQREEMSAALDRMEQALASVESIDSLEPAAKTQLFNDQELINNLLTKSYEDSRLICKREKRVGSHRYTNVCISVGERRRQRDGLQRDAAYLQRGSSLQSD